MIFQQWIMSCCDGKPSEAIRRIEAVSSEPISASTIYRALRTPQPLAGKLARAVVKASEELCTLAELVDIEVIRAHFVYSNPDLQRRGMEFQILQAQSKLKPLETKLHHARLAVQKQEAEITRLVEALNEAFPQHAQATPAQVKSTRAELRIDDAEFLKPERGIVSTARRREPRVAARPAKRPKKKRSARGRRAVAA